MKIYEKEKSVLQEFKVSTTALQKNYMKWLAEYNTINQKLAIRDKMKDKNDTYDIKITEVQNEKFKQR